MKAQFRKADASGARYALIFAPEEAAKGCLIVKDLRDGTGAQRECALADVAQWAPSLKSSG